MRLPIACFVSGIALTVAVQASDPPKHAEPAAAHGDTCSWSYSPTHDGVWGPGDWAHCSPACNGQRQSPVDLSSSSGAGEGSVPLRWGGPQSLSVAGNGHTIVATPAQITPDTVRFGQTGYTLQQFHFHAPSEHTIHGQTYAAELHFVTTDAQGNYLVIAVLLEKGATLPGDDTYLQLMSAAAAGGGKVSVDSLLSLLPPIQTQLDSYYTYKGSLTTPPCTESVQFVVLKSPRTLAPATLEKVVSTNRALNHGDNARPIQPLGSRVIEALPPDAR